MIEYKNGQPRTNHDCLVQQRTYGEKTVQIVGRFQSRVSGDLFAMHDGYR
jgi:hypothetical protein